VEYRINYTVRDYGVQDAVNLIDRDPGSLSHFEMFQAAESFGRGSERFNQILLDTVLRYFPDDETAHLNAAAILIERGDLSGAGEHLSRAGNSAAALNNRGVLALMEGNLDQADSYFTRAQQIPNGTVAAEAAHNRNQVSLQREENERRNRVK
jgi:Tfp pilus assembly protein PilF